MKKLLFKIIMALSLLVYSCDWMGDFGDMNKDPNLTSDPIPSALLSNALSDMAKYGANVHYQPGLYAQYLAQTQYTEASLYSLPQLNFVDFYTTNLVDLQNVRLASPDNTSMQGVAIILQQYIFWYLTDCWGDIPYSEALQGVVPAYDSQEQIYQGMLSELARAVTLLEGEATLAGDLVYGGDRMAWQRLANSMRMLMALQLSKKIPGAEDFAAAEFRQAMAATGGYMRSNSDNFTLAFPGGNFKSPWRNTYDGRRDYAQSKTMTDITAALEDSRRQVFGGATEDLGATSAFVSSTVGFPYGLTRADAENFASQNPSWARVLRGDFRTDNAPYALLTAGQVLLAQAEAITLGWTKEDLAEAYAEGIALSHQQWGVSMAVGYMQQAAVALDGGADDAAKVVLQRYLAHYPDGHMGWNIWRKSAIPTLMPAPAASPGVDIPRRFVYGQTEYATNGEHVNEALARLPSGQDLMSERVWWDRL